MNQYQDDGAKVATQTPVIEVTSRQLEKAHAELSEIVAALEGRLSPVMREPEPTSPRANAVDMPTQSPLGSLLRQRVAEAESLAYRLSSIVRRLEV